MPPSLIDLMTDQSGKRTLAEKLARSGYDDLIEVDLLNNRCTTLSSVDGKFYVPLRNGSWHDLYRYCRDHMVHPEDREAYAALMDPETLARRLQESSVPGALSGRFRYRLTDGSWRWVEQVVICGPEHSLQAGIIHLYLFDIQNLMDREAGVSRETSSVSEDRDALTGLRPRHSFFAAAEAMLQACRGDYCFVVIDIEHFRLFNDWFGREAGDLLLAEIGALLKEQENSVAGYLGQDDFCLVIPRSLERIEQIYLKIRGFERDRGCDFGFLPAVGISPITGSPVLLDLLDEASAAASLAKSGFRDRIRFFDSSMRGKQDQEYRLLMDFQNALKNRGIFFVLQPQCRISTRRIVGAECLARWRMADGRMILPGDFVPVLEKYGFVTQLDRYIWEEVCIWLRRWMDDGHHPVPISINVSPMDLFSLDVPEFLEKLTREYRIPHKLLNVEITESAYVENTSTVCSNAARLQEAGFTVMMDDFGTGCSSLTMLSRLNVDALKVDAQFLRVSRSREEEKGIRILESVVNMSKTMALPIIVEGVETQAQLSFLNDLGCQYIQGYHFYRPMAVSDFEALAADEENLDRQGILFHASLQVGIREFMDSNIYSDAMLNNILGGVAFYLQHGKDGREIDITRYNEQFYEVVDAPDIQDRLHNTERFIHPKDLERFYDLFRRAEEDRLNGASGMLAVYGPDGRLGQYWLRLYFLTRESRGKKFYGQLQDMTQYYHRENQMRILAEFSSESVIFLSMQEKKALFRVAVHGLRKELGMTAEELEDTLNSRRFMDRLDPGSRETVWQVMQAAREKHHGFEFPFRLLNGPENHPVDLYIKADPVHDDYSDVAYIIFLRTQVRPTGAYPAGTKKKEREIEG